MLAALAALVFFVTCNNHVEPPVSKQLPLADGMGRVAIRIAGTEARTFLPDVGGLKYKLTVVRTGESTPVVDEIFDNGKLSWSGLIYRGTYTVTIVGYETDITFPALRGTETLTVTAGETSNIAVVLNPTEIAAGKLFYNVSVPETMNLLSGELRIEAISEVPSPNPVNLAVDGMSGSITLQTGYYRIFLEVIGAVEDEKGIYKTTAVVYIVDGITTNVVYDLTEDDFNYREFCSVVFDLNYNGAPDPVIREVIYGNKAAELLPDSVRFCFIIVGWCTDRELTERYDFNTLVFENFTLYAKWSDKVIDVSQVQTYLSTQPGKGDSAGNPAMLPVQIDLGTMTNSTDNWRQLLDAINTAGKYVHLDLSTSIIGGGATTEFNPVSSVATGKNYIVSIVLPNTAEIIPGVISDATFRFFTNLKSVTGANITTIGTRAFNELASLTTVNLPKLTSIPIRAFYDCTSLIVADFPNATFIDAATFYRCTSLTTANFPNAATVGSQAFIVCSSLTTVNFPNAARIGTEAFSWCDNLTTADFPNVTSIANGAFQMCYSLTTADFPELTSIPSNAFYGCDSLTTANFPNAASIGSQVFRGNSDLTITLGTTAPTLEGMVFPNVTAKTVTVLVPREASGYTPFNGSAITVSGSDTTEHWANGFRGAGWTGSTFSGGAGNINQNITVIIKRTSILPEMVWVPGGSFLMGNDGEGALGDEQPAHPVTVSGFYMGKYEITNAQFADVMGWHTRGEDNTPISMVTWYDACNFCNQLSIQEGLTPVYTITIIEDYVYIENAIITADFSKNGYRLPTEAEWEYAAKGGDGSPGNYRYSGSNNADEVAWYRGNSQGTVNTQPYRMHVVGTKAPNGLGLYDMSGNVFEWCWDWYGNYSAESQINPTGASTGTYRVIRGGNWYSYANDLHITRRSEFSFSPNYRSSGQVGFRIVCRP